MKTTLPVQPVRRSWCYAFDFAAWSMSSFYADESKTINTLLVQSVRGSWCYVFDFAAEVTRMLRRPRWSMSSFAALRARLRLQIAYFSNGHGNRSGVWGNGMC
eukprot:2094845-Rhodomonas_salina.2